MLYVPKFDSFKIKDIKRELLNYKSYKLEGMVDMLNYILDEDLTLSEKVVYFKNINRYVNRDCNISQVFIYIVHNGKLHIICYDENKKQSIVNSYPVENIKKTILRKGRNIELTIFFNEYDDEDEYILNNYEDTFDEENTEVLADAIIDLYRKINN